MIETGRIRLRAFLGFVWGNKIASERDRTSDLLITNQPLYRLSYAGPKDRIEKTGKEL